MKRLLYAGVALCALAIPAAADTDPMQLLLLMEANRATYQATMPSYGYGYGYQPYVIQQQQQIYEAPPANPFGLQGGWRPIEMVR